MSSARLSNYEQRALSTISKVPKLTSSLVLYSEGASPPRPFPTQQIGEIIAPLSLLVGRPDLEFGCVSHFVFSMCAATCSTAESYIL